MHTPNVYFWGCGERYDWNSNDYTPMQAWATGKNSDSSHWWHRAIRSISKMDQVLLSGSVSHRWPMEGLQKENNREVWVPCQRLFHIPGKNSWKSNNPKLQGRHVGDTEEKYFGTIIRNPWDLFGQRGDVTSSNLYLVSIPGSKNKAPKSLVIPKWWGDRNSFCNSIWA